MQSFQWKEVFIDTGYFRKEMLDKNYLRWIYTAFTRATEKLYLIGFNDEFSTANSIKKHFDCYVLSFTLGVNIFLIIDTPEGTNHSSFPVNIKKTVFSISLATAAIIIRSIEMGITVLTIQR